MLGGCTRCRRQMQRRHLAGRCHPPFPIRVHHHIAASPFSGMLPEAWHLNAARRCGAAQANLAADVNRAVLSHQGAQDKSPLERLVRQGVSPAPALHASLPCDGPSFLAQARNSWRTDASHVSCSGLVGLMCADTSLIHVFLASLMVWCTTEALSFGLKGIALLGIRLDRAVCDFGGPSFFFSCFFFLGTSHETSKAVFQEQSSLTRKLQDGDEAAQGWSASTSSSSW